MTVSSVSLRSAFFVPMLWLAAGGNSTQALATEVRVRTLSAPAGIEDEAKVFLYPSLVTKYSLAVAEFGTFADQEAYAMAIAKLSSMSIGAAISRDASLFSYFNPATNWNDENDFMAYNFGKYSLNRRYSAAMVAQPRRPVDLFMGWALEGDKSLGLRLTLAGDTREIKNEAQKAEANAEQLDFRMGFSLPAADGRADLSVGVGILGKQEVETDPEVGDTVAERYERGLALSASGRWLSGSTEKARPFLKAGLKFANPKTKAQGSETKTKKGNELFVDAQGGYQYAPVENVLLNGHMGGFYIKSEGSFALGAANPPAPPAGGGAAPAPTAVDADSVQNGNYKVTAVDGESKAKVTGYGLALGGGAEGLVSENWGLMVGLNYLLWGRLKTNDGNGPGKTEFNTNLPQTPDSALWSLGMYYKRQSLRVDGSMTLKRFVHNGPHFVTGNATTPFVAQFAASYNF